MIPRIASHAVKKLADQFKAVGVIGPRQSGKTTLVRSLFKNKPYVNLENPDIRRFALEDPRGFLLQYAEGAILDEAQRVPELFSYLQQHLDEHEAVGQFIITGSNNFLLQENISQSLAGRIAYLKLLPFSISEVNSTKNLRIEEVLYKGMYPPLYDKKFDINQWYANYIQTYIERDVRQIKNVTDLVVFERFIRLCAGRIGQLLNMNNLANEVGVDSKTIASWIGVLESSFVIFRLQPYHKSFNKRIVKMPKLYFYDTGLASALLSIQQADQLVTHPLKGVLFENFCLNELVKMRLNAAKSPNLFFWRDNTGHELDIVVENGQKLFPIEIKSGQTINNDYFKGLVFWQKLTGSKEGMVVYGGDQPQKRSDGISVISWKELDQIDFK